MSRLEAQPTQPQTPQSPRERYLAALLEVQRQLLMAKDSSSYPAILECLGQASGASRVYIFENEFVPNRLIVSQRAEWCAAGIPSELSNPQLQNQALDELFPDWAQLMQQGETIAVVTVDLAAAQRCFLEAQGVRAIVQIPIVADGELLGFLGFDNCLSDRLWQADELELLRSAATAIVLWHDRKRTEEALRQQEAQYRGIFENTQVGILRTRWPDGLILAANQRAIALYGFDSIETVVGHKYARELYANPADRQQVLEAVQQTKTLHLELLARHQNGSTFWVLLSGRLSDSEEYLDVLITDISDRKRSEAALQESERRFRAIFQHSGVAIGISRPDGTVLANNPAWMQMLGYSEAEYQQLTFRELTHADDIAADLALYQELLAGQRESFQMEKRYLHKNGQPVWVSLTLSAVRDSAGAVQFIIAMSKDISEQKQAEAALMERVRLAALSAEIGVALTQGSTLRDMLGRCAEALCQHLDAAFARIWTLNDSESVLELQASAGLYTHLDGAHSRIPIGQLKIGTIAQTRQPCCINNVQQDPQIRDRAWAVREGIVAFAGYPLIVDDRVVGVMAVFGRQLLPDTALQEMACIANEVALGIKHKRSEEALRRSEARFRSLYQSTSTAVVLADVSAGVFDCNPAAEQLFGYSCQELLGKHPADFSPAFQPSGEPSWELANQQMAIAYAQGSHRFEWLHQRADGSTFPAEVWLTVIEEGDRRLVQAVVQDLTERKQTEAVLERRAQVESLLSSISRQFIDQDAETAIEFTLAAVAGAIGADRSCIFDISPDQSQAHISYEWCAEGIAPLTAESRGGSFQPFAQFQQILSGTAFQIPHVADLPADAPERQLFAQQSIQSVVMVPMRHAGKVVGLIGADAVQAPKIWSQDDINLLRLVGELVAIGRARQRAETALRAAKDAAEVASRAKSQFLSNMSHELRTPLNVILGFTQLMARSEALDAQQQGYLDTINRSGEHLLTLINDVLEMSKIEAGRASLNQGHCHLGSLLDWLQRMLRVRAESKRLRLRFELPPDLPRCIYTDEGKLRQVLMNLLGNAIKFTQVGQVTLRVQVAPEESGPPDFSDAGDRSLPARATPIRLQFEVEDTGPGIAAADRERLFEAFVQTEAGRNSQEGTGLGLSISRRFVRLMGGDIHVRSLVGVGSTFSFSIRTAAIAPETAPAPLHPQVVGLEPGQPTYRILVAEDKQENCQFMSELLGSVGFAVRIALNGEEAIALTQTWSPHLIWMDMRMPTLDGYAATRRIKAMPPPNPTIIALTGSAFEEDRIVALAIGCDDFVRKPVRAEVLFEKMADYLGVRYRYADRTLAPAPPASSPFPFPPSPHPSSLPTLTAALTAMPPDWIRQLHEAARRVNAREIHALIQRIPAAHVDLADALTHLVSHFRFEEILALTQGDPYA